MEMLKKFNLVCEEYLDSLNGLNGNVEGIEEEKLIDSTGNLAEGLMYGELKDVPNEEYKYACVLKLIDENTFETLTQFEVPVEIQRMEDEVKKLELVKDIVKLVEPDRVDSKRVVKFLNRIETRAFTLIKTPVEEFYPSDSIPWKNM